MRPQRVEAWPRRASQPSSRSVTAASPNTKTSGRYAPPVAQCAPQATQTAASARSSVRRFGQPSERWSSPDSRLTISPRCSARSRLRMAHQSRLVARNQLASVTPANRRATAAAITIATPTSAVKRSHDPRSSSFRWKICTDRIQDARQNSAQAWRL